MSEKRVVGDLLSDRPIVAVDSNSTVLDAARLMHENKCGSVLVMDGATLLGIFTERDMVIRVVAVERDPAVTPVTEVMTIDPKVVRADESCHYALLMMDENLFRHLPVVSSDRNVIGVISRRDFAGEERIWIEQMRIHNSALWARL